MDLHLQSKGNPNQQRYVPQKDSQSRKLLREALVEGNPPFYSDLKMTSRGPGPAYLRQDDSHSWLCWTTAQYLAGLLPSAPIGQLVPKRLVLRSSGPLVNCDPRQFITKSVETQDSRHPRQLTPKTTGPQTN
ncbi:hypothetical protein E2C01_011184 [Portunus trituberculatus]|uniref:Uncharacterized protein n=1 Tax=Portunus trituberculatus TaxID=210409 RepID=A0A5B7DAD5_PORTR|nr:hypothetical protein [Portunus trituberculatus]